MPELICAASAPEWLAERRKGVTATDITAILGLSPYQSPYGLWWEKTSLDMPEHQDSDRLRLGRELEPYITARWNEQHWPEFLSKAAGLFRSTERPWQLATSDRLTSPVTGDMPCPLEVKSWADADKTSWQDGPPARVRAQILWQMDTLDVGTGHVGVVFLPSGEFRSYVVEHGDLCRERGYWTFGADEDCGACVDLSAMRAAGWEFYRRMTGELPPPDVDGSAATLTALRARFADPRKDKSAPVDAELWERWTDYRHDRDVYEGMMRGAEARIREQLGEATLIEVDEQIVGRRIIIDAAVKAHERHQDYLKVIKREGDGTDGTE